MYGVCEDRRGAGFSAVVAVRDYEEGRSAGLLWSGLVSAGLYGEEGVL